MLLSSGPDDKSIYVDANTRIQIVETMMDLPTADKEQSAAFIVSTVIRRPIPSRLFSSRLEEACFSSFIMAPCKFHDAAFGFNFNL